MVGQRTVPDTTPSSVNGEVQEDVVPTSVLEMERLNSQPPEVCPRSADGQHDYLDHPFDTSWNLCHTPRPESDQDRRDRITAGKRASVIADKTIGKRRTCSELTSSETIVADGRRPKWKSSSLGDSSRKQIKAMLCPDCTAPKGSGTFPFDSGSS